jgi:hypothetical protein
MSTAKSDWERWGPNPMAVDEIMIQRGAEVLRADHEEEHGQTLSWQDFAGRALRVITAPLTDTRWEDW